MKYTLSGFWTAILASVIMLILLRFVTKNKKIYQKINPEIIIFFSGLIITRILFPVEVKYAKGIFLHKIVPVMDSFFRFRLIETGGAELTVWKLLLFLWGAVCIWKISRMISEYIVTRNILLNLPEVNFRELSVSKNMEDTLISAKKIKYRVTPEYCSPFIFGIIHPIIVLPAIVLQFPPEEIQMILHHELNHRRKGDCILKIVLVLFSCIFWWFPFISSLLEKTEEAMEVRADWNTTRKMSESQKTKYLAALYHLSEECLKQNKNLLYSNAFSNNQAKTLERRFRCISASPDWHFTKTMYALSIGLFLLSYLFIVEPRYEPRDSSAKCEKICTVYIQDDETYEIYMDGKYLGIMDNLDFLNSPDFNNIKTKIYERKIKQ